MKPTQILMRMNPTQVRAFDFDEFPNATMDDLAKLGITMDEKDAGVVAAMDTAPAMVTTPSVATPIQFLQWWMPGMIQVLTKARRADRVMGRTIAGAAWEDEQIVVTVKENIGQPQPYGDDTDVPLVSYNTNFVTRSNVRFEMGIKTGRLEDARAARMRVNPYAEKRTSLAEAAAIELNAIAFYGYDSYDVSLNPTGGATYGLLNAPELPSATALAGTGTGGATTFASKDYTAICNDFITAMNALRVNTGDNFDPATDGVVCAIASSAFQYLDKQNELGTQSVREFVMKQYPGLRFVSVPELDNMGGAGVHGMYFICDTLGGSACSNQFVTSLLRLLGVEPKMKGTLEGYTFSTAGFIGLQPLGFLRYTGC